MRPFSRLALGILALATFTSALGFQAAPTLVLYYKFDEAAGNTAVDSSGNGYNGTWTVTANSGASVSASTDVAPNVLGNAHSLIFTKPTNALQAGAFVDTPNNSAFTFTGAFSAMAWIKPAALAAGQNTNDRGSICHKWDYTTQQLSGWSFERERDGRITFITGSRTETDYLRTGGSDLVPNGQWHHVAVVYDGSNKMIYLDGTVRATQPTSIIPAVSNANLHIGKDDYNRNFHGNIDDVKLFSGALTAAQVLSCYQGVDAPTNLTATPGPNEATLHWTAVSNAASYNVYRSTTAGGPYSFLANVSPGTTTGYLDTTVTFPNTYYYVVQSVVGTLTSVYSNEASCTPTKPQIVVSPTAIMVAENGGTATFTVTLLTRPTTMVTIALASGDPSVLRINGPGGTPGGTATLTFLNNQPLSQTVTATGVERYVQGYNLTVPITFTSVTSTDPLYPPGFKPRPVSCTIVQDLPGLVINPAAGLATTNGGSAITFTVALSTQTFGNAALTFGVSDPNLATVSPAGPVVLTAANSPVTVTVTPLSVDTRTTYMAPYSIVIDSSTSTDPGYAALGSTAVPIFTDTSLPPLEHVWGCGLIGPEGLLAMGAVGLWRRRRARRSA
ncbi:MAG: hypothetical protein JO332_06160 [Planctomycetaceae bacterium]|nr:hypothetical protein [Planctomycetaceae bacterium]